MNKSENQCEFAYRALNDATSSQNPMHRDLVAREMGFTSALVVGVTSLSAAFEAMFGLAGEEAGQDCTVSVAFRRPVYVGEDMVARAQRPSDTCNMAFSVNDREGTERIGGTSALGVAPDPDAPPFPESATPESPVYLNEGNLLDTRWLKTVSVRADRTSVEERVASWCLPENHLRGSDIVHPGYLIRLCVESINATFERPMPQVHVGSMVQLGRQVRMGEKLSVRGRIDRLRGRSGHRRYVLDSRVYVADELVLMSEHEVIYRLAQQRSD